MKEATKISAGMTALLVAANIALAVILGLFAWFTAWSGPSFTSGFIGGAFFVLAYSRIKLGYWI